MAFQGAIPIDFGTLFPDGAYAAGVFEAVRDFDRSQGDRFVQQLDKGTGLPMWVADVIDADPKARDRTVKVKVVAEYQPTLPPAPAGSPFAAVEFTGMTVTRTSTRPGGWPTPSRQPGPGTLAGDGGPVQR
jgi:hypothetical protein